MSTLWSYVPIIGDFSPESFDLRTIAGDVIPLDTTLTLGDVGKPRPGVLKWVFTMHTNNTLFNNDEEVLIKVPTPFSFTQKERDERYNALFPLITFMPIEPNTNVVAWCDPFYGASVEEQKVTLHLQAAGAAGVTPAGYEIIVDFSHSAIN